MAELRFSRFVRQAASGFLMAFSFSLTFTASGRRIGTAPVNNGIAAITTNSLALGKDNLRASYPGDTNFTPSASSTLSYTITASQALTSECSDGQAACPIGNP